MTSNNDLMTYLMKMEENRAKEREEDKIEWKEVREKERQEDKEEITKVIDKCLEEKMTEAIKPFEEKTESVVQAQAQMKEQVDTLSKELMGLKEKISSIREVSTRPGNGQRLEADNLDRIQQGLGSTVGQVAEDVAVVGGGQSVGLAEIISEARRTVGLYRIDQADLDRMRQEQYGAAKTPEEEKHLAVKEYLKLELKLDTNTVERMQIEKTFYLNRDNPECLFVTFEHRSSVSRIFDKTFLMRKESRVKTYIPRQFRDRARAISEFEYNLREVEKCKTKVKMGLKDLQLFKKARRGGKWEQVPLSDAELPPVDMGSSGSPSRTVSTSPAPGRPSQTRSDKRGRESTGSSNGTNPKAARKENEDDSSDEEISEARDWNKALKEATLVTDSALVSPGKDGAALMKQPDLGMVMSITGTPVKPLPPSTNHVNSPIF